MFCPFCGAGLPDGAGVCSVCHRPPTTGVLVGDSSAVTSPTHPSPLDMTVLADGANAETSLGAPGIIRPPVTPSASSTTLGAPPATLASGIGFLGAGSSFGRRYHIIRLLGMGGMGAVYQAWDDELGVAVALKIIRPEISADPAAARDLERRFKRELLLARQVTGIAIVEDRDPSTRRQRARRT
jgi:serine/threonine protein kinase